MQWLLVIWIELNGASVYQRNAKDGLLLTSQYHYLMFSEQNALVVSNLDTIKGASAYQCSAKDGEFLANLARFENVFAEITTAEWYLQMWHRCRTATVRQSLPAYHVAIATW